MSAKGTVNASFRLAGYVRSGTPSVSKVALSDPSGQGSLWEGPAISSHPIGQKIATPVAGFNVLPP